MKNFLAKLILACVLVFGVVTAIEGPVLAACTNCTCNVNPTYPIGPYCLSYTPGYPPGGYPCSGTPGAGDVFVYTGTNFSGLCVGFPMQNIGDFEYYGLNGPTYKVGSIKFGSGTGGWLYQSAWYAGGAIHFSNGGSSSNLTSFVPVSMHVN